MLSYLPILKIHARQVLDSRGNPTIETEITAGKEDNYYTGKAIVPSGASTGQFEAVELRDGIENNYRGLSVENAVSNVNTIIFEKLKGKNVFDQADIDHLLIELDGTKNKQNLGANAILSVSLAAAHTGANALGMPLFRYIGGISAYKMPVPMMNIINGGAHAGNALDFQEFMIMPVSADTFKDALRIGVDVYQTLKKVLSEKNMSTAVGDEGGFAPDISSAYEALSLLTEAVEKAGYETGTDIAFAMDAAASELYNKESGMYYFPGETKSKYTNYNENCNCEDECICQPVCDCGEEKAKVPDTNRIEIIRSADEMISYYEDLVNEFPLISIEDGLDEEDWQGWKKLTKRLGDRIQLVGDDLFVTNTERLNRGIYENCANSILIKLNQIGTLSETIYAIKTAQEAGYTAVVSHRSGETEDVTIADFSVALNCGQIKTGAPCRSERVSKYNQLIRIEEQIKYFDRL